MKTLLIKHIFSYLTPHSVSQCFCLYGCLIEMSDKVLCFSRRPPTTASEKIFPLHKIWPKQTFTEIQKSNSKLNMNCQHSDKLLVALTGDLYRPLSQPQGEDHRGSWQLHSGEKKLSEHSSSEGDSVWSLCVCVTVCVLKLPPVMCSSVIRATGCVCSFFLHGVVSVIMVL